MVFQFLKDGQLFKADAFSSQPGFENGDEDYQLPEDGSNVFLNGTLYTIEKSSFHLIEEKFGKTTVVQIHVK